MFGDCHIHMILDGVYYRAAIDHQKSCPDEALIRERLKNYVNCGVTFLRDGGDAWGVGLRASQIAGGMESHTAPRSPTSAVKGIMAVSSAGVMKTWLNTGRRCGKSRKWAVILLKSWYPA